MQLGNRRFHCWKKHGHGWMDMNRRASSQSCDVYFYDVARKVGIDRIADMARRSAWATVTGIDLPGERPGLIPTQAWKLAKDRRALAQGRDPGHRHRPGLRADHAAAAGGDDRAPGQRRQGGGAAPDPRPRRSRGEAEALPAGARAVGYPSIWASEPPRSVRQGMDAVVNGHRAARRAARPSSRRAWEMAGKTGTAQVRRITKAERERGVRKNEDLAWRERDHALFVAYAPVDKPRYAVSVVVEHGGGGSKAAAPIARDILIETQRRDPRLRWRALPADRRRRQRGP